MFLVAYGWCWNYGWTCSLPGFWQLWQELHMAGAGVADSWRLEGPCCSLGGAVWGGRPAWQQSGEIIYIGIFIELQLYSRELRKRSINRLLTYKLTSAYLSYLWIKFIFLDDFTNIFYSLLNF